MLAVYEDILCWGVHLLASFKALRAWIYMSFSFSGCLGMLNLGISALVYHSTKAEQRQRMISESGPSTRPNRRRSTYFSFLFSFTSVLTGLLNFGGAFFRSWHIHLLEIPTTWLTKGGDGAGDSIMQAELMKAEWIVAVNDWGSLFLTIAFLLAGCFNFATVRQLRLLKAREEERLLPVVVEKGDIVGSEDARTFALEEKQRIFVEDTARGLERERTLRGA